MTMESFRTVFVKIRSSEETSSPEPKEPTLFEKIFQKYSDRFRRNYLVEMTKTLRFFARLYFAIEWDKKREIFVYSSSMWKNCAFVVKTIVFGCYAVFQVSNLQLAAVDRRKKLLTVSMMMNIGLTASAILIFYFHLLIWRKRKYLMGAFNAFATLYKKGNMQSPSEDGTRAPLPRLTFVLLQSSVCYTREQLYFYVISLVEMYLLSRKQNRFLITTLPSELQESWLVIGISVLVEAFIIVHIVTSVNVMWGLTLLYATQMHCWLLELEKLKVETATIWNRPTLNMMQQALVRKRKFSKIISSYYEIKILASWFNTCYEKLLFLPLRTWMTVIHSTLCITIILFYDTLPTTIAAMFGFWSIALFPCLGVFIKCLACVVTASERFTTTWGFAMGPYEKRVTRSLQPFGIKAGKVVRETDVLKYIIVVSKLSKNFLLLG